MSEKKRKSRVKLDMYSFVGTIAIAYPEWMGPKTKKVYWALLLASSSILKYYMFFFGIWTAMIISQMLFPNYILWICAASFLCLLGLIGFSIVQSVNASKAHIART